MMLVMAAFGSAQRLMGIYQNDGSLQLLNDGRSVGLIRFWIFGSDWLPATPSAGMIGSNGSVTNTFDLNGTSINVQTTFSTTNGVTTITVNATPSATITTQSDNINFLLDPAYWTGSTATLNGTQRSLSGAAVPANDLLGVGSSFSFVRPDGVRINVTNDTPQPFLYQDSRRYNIGYEFRYGIRSGIWPGGQTRTYTAKISFDAPIPIAPAGPMTIMPNNGWVGVAPTTTIEAGTALDWSIFLTGPSGNRGWLMSTTGGQFAFTTQPNTVQRFNGTNLSFDAAVPSKAEAPRIVNLMARMGYNSVRLHHVDARLNPLWANDSTSIDNGQLDKFFYFLSLLKQRGFYVSLDLWSYRLPKDNEIYPGNLDQFNYKALLLVNSAVRNHWANFATQLLTRVNPYTGMAIKDDPSVAWLCLVNENDPVAFAPNKLRPDVLSQLQVANGGRAWDPTTDAGARDAAELAKGFQAWAVSVVRQTGAKQLITDANVGYLTATSALRGTQAVDYVDTHWYAPQPTYTNGEGQIPVRLENWSLLQRPYELGRVAGTRVAGKPFTLSEYSTVYPNQYRSELGLVIGTLASVQQWGGIWSFNFMDTDQDMKTAEPCDYIHLWKDPISLASERAAIALFSRSDLRTTDALNVVNLPANQTGNFDMSMNPFARSGAFLRAFGISATSGSSNQTDPMNNGQIVRADGQVAADFNNMKLCVSTQNTCGVIAWPDQQGTAGILTATARGSRATVWVSSVDRKPINQSRRMLLTHLTDVQNAGATYADPTRELMTNYGDLPHLAKDGDVEVTLRMPQTQGVRVFRLDMAGRRTQQVTITRTSTSISFRATMRNPATNTATFYYEIVR